MKFLSNTCSYINNYININKIVLFMLIIFLSMHVYYIVSNKIDSSIILIFIISDIILSLTVMFTLCKYHCITNKSITIDSIVDGVITIDQNGIILTFNKVCEELFGYSSEYAIGKNVSILMNKTDSKHHDRYMQKYNKTGKKNIIGIGREVTGKHKDGTLFPMFLSVAEVQEFNKKKFIGTIRDLREEKKILKDIEKYQNELESLVDERTKQLNIATDEAIKANQLKSEILSNITHELKTPIFAISGLASAAMKRIDKWDNEKQINNLEHIINNNERLLNLVNNLLELSKNEHKILEPHFEKNNLNELVDSYLQDCDILIKNKNIKIQFKTIKLADNIEFDYTQISQIINNLLSNAIKFSPHGGKINISIKKDTIHSKDAIKFSIKDEGAGIPNNELKHIFEKFIQASNIKDGSGGTGLGLAICKKNIKAHNGIIKAENNKDKGANFYFIIPIKQQKNET